MVMNEDGILEFLSQMKEALDSYIDLRNTNILSIAFTKDEYDDYISLLTHLESYDVELTQLVEEEDLNDEIILCLAGLLIYDISQVCHELHDHYGEEANLKVEVGNLDENKIALVKLLKSFKQPLVADWQSLEDTSKNPSLFVTIQLEGEYAYYKAHATQKEAYLYALSHGIPKDHVFNRMLV